MLQLLNMSKQTGLVDFSDLIPIISIILENYNTIQETSDGLGAKSSSSSSSSSSNNIDNGSVIGGCGGGVVMDLAAAVSPVHENELEYVIDRLLRLHEWYEDADNVPLIKLIRQQVVDQTFDLTSTLESVKDFTSKSWSKADIDKCVKRKFKAASSNKYMNFDFNSLPDFEPLEFTLRSLRANPGDVIALQKICNMDFGEFVEHPQWEEFLTLIGKALLSSNENATIESLRIHAKLLVSFSGNQYIHVCLNLLNHFRYIWCKGAELSYGRCSNPKAGIIQKLLQFDLLKQLISSLLLVIHTLPENTVSTSEKLVDTAIATLFLVLSHGYIEVEYDDDQDDDHDDDHDDDGGDGDCAAVASGGGRPRSAESESRSVSIKVSILDIILPQLLKSDSIKKLVNTWPHAAVVSHALHSSFIHVLLQRAKFALTLPLAVITPDMSSSASAREGGEVDDDNDQSGFDFERQHEVAWQASYFISAINIFLTIIETATSNTALLKVFLISLSDLMRPIDRSVEDADKLLCYHPYDMYWDGKMESKMSSFGSLFVLMQPIEELNKRHYQLAGSRLNPFDLFDKDVVLDNSSFTGAMFLRFCSDEDPEVFLEVLSENVVSKISTVSLNHFPFLLKLLDTLMLILLKRSSVLHDSIFSKIWIALVKLSRGDASFDLFSVFEFIMRHMKRMNQSRSVSSIEIYIQVLLHISDIIFSNHYFLNPFYSFTSIDPRLLQVLDLYYSSWLRLMSWSQGDDEHFIYRCEVWSKLTQLNLSSKYNDEINMDKNIFVLKEVFDFSIAICRNIEARLAKLSKNQGGGSVSALLNEDDSSSRNSSSSSDNDSEDLGSANDIKGNSSVSSNNNSSVSEGGAEVVSDDAKATETASAAALDGTGSSSDDGDGFESLLPDMKSVLSLKLFCSRVFDFICQFCKDFSNCSVILRKDASVFKDALRILTRIVSLNVSEEKASDTGQLFSLYFNNIDVVSLEQAYTALLNCLSVINTDAALPKDLYVSVLEDFSIVIDYLELSAESIFDVCISGGSSDSKDESIKCFANICRSFIASGYYNVMVDLWTTHWTPLVEILSSRTLNFSNFSFYLENMNEDVSSESLYPLFNYIFDVTLVNSGRMQAVNSVMRAGYSADNDLFFVGDLDDKSIHIKDFSRLFMGNYHINCGFLSSLSPMSSDTELFEAFECVNSSIIDTLSDTNREHFTKSLADILSSSASDSPTIPSMHSEFQAKYDQFSLDISGNWSSFLAANDHYRFILDDLCNRNFLARCENILAPSAQILSFVIGVELFCHELSIKSAAFVANPLAIMIIIAISMCESKMAIIGLICHLIDESKNLELLKMGPKDIRLFLFDQILQFNDAKYFISMFEALFLNLISIHPVTAFIDVNIAIDLTLRYITQGPDAVLQLVATLFDALETLGYKSRNANITYSNAYAILRKVCGEVKNL